MKKFFRKVVHIIRQHTPLWVRWKIGPVLAYSSYFVRMHILGNKDAPKVLSVEDTLDLIIKDNLSVIRFGDGEITLIEKNDLLFQKADPQLITRLKEILKSNIKGLLICVPGLFGSLEGYARDAYRFALHHQFHYRHMWLEFLSPSQVYGDTLITRPYLAYKQELRENSGEVFKKIFSIWQGRDVVLIEGEKSRLGVGNNMFQAAKSVSRILCPPENAYSKYAQILEATTKVKKENLILLSLGPAAKVLAYDLFLAGYRVIDIGHIDMEYEMYLRQEPVLTKVRYKYFNEINERDPDQCVNPEYLGQIISRIV